MKNRFHPFTLLPLVLLLIARPCGGEEPSRPNVLFIAIDDLRPELGCYGDTVALTPHIDTLASQGMIFERAYCQVAVCGASRASMMTSILPTDTRYTGYRSRADKDTPMAVTLGQTFKEAGYTTVAHGKIFHNSSDASERTWSRRVNSSGLPHTTAFDPATTQTLSERGRGLFYESIDVADDAYPDGIVANNTIADLRTLKEAGEPFFLACGFIRPHLPFYAPKKYWDLYDEEEIPLADNQYLPVNAPKSLRGSREHHSYAFGDFDPDSQEFHRKMRHGYLASTSYVDQLVGNVLGELQNLELAGNTVVIIWGDHGWHLGEHTFWGKHNTMHKALRIPLIVRVPGKTSGERSKSLVSSVDLFPTLCDLVGLEIPASVQGKSFKPILSDPHAEINNSVYARFGNADAIITERYTYSEYKNGDVMLYDLLEDPDENRNIAGDPSKEPIKASLQEKLERFITKARSATY